VSPTHPHIHSESGQALVEFALVLPVLLIVLLGIVDFGRALNYYNDATHLSAEAARFAVVNRKPDVANAASLQLQIHQQADSPELRNGSTSVTNAAQVCVDFPNGTQLAGDPVRVQVGFTYSWLPFLDIGAATISASSVMRLEAAPTTYSVGCA
jgi:Flp pilus assembly protein TadG